MNGHRGYVQTLLIDTSFLLLQFSFCTLLLKTSFHIHTLRARTVSYNLNCITLTLFISEQVYLLCPTNNEIYTIYYLNLSMIPHIK